MTRLLATTAICALIGLPAAAAPLMVTSTEDAGEGSLRAALETASAGSGAQAIVVAVEGTITLAAPLSYSGTGALTITGTGQTIQADGDFTLLETSATQSLTITDLAFAGPGDFSIEAQGGADGAEPGKGIFVDVADGATGEVRLALSNVSVTGTAGHGIHVSDCSLADACGAGGGGEGEGSAASIALQLVNVSVLDTSYGRFDADGIRVDERGPGDVHFAATALTVEGAGADGVELDEGQEGSVIVEVVDGVFVENGGYCDPDLLAAFLPDAPEGEFAEGEVQDGDIPGPIADSPDDGCFEREVEYHGDGSVAEYEFGIDVDDGFDVDEAGPGDIEASFIGGEMAGNLDEGYDFDEEGPGGVDAAFVYLSANENTDDGIKISEEDAGDVIGLVSASEAVGNGGVGFVFEEADGGNLTLTVATSSTVGNDGGELGIEGVQEDDGDGVVYVIATEVADGIETEGAEIVPN